MRTRRLMAGGRIRESFRRPRRLPGQTEGSRVYRLITRAHQDNHCPSTGREPQKTVLSAAGLPLPCRYLPGYRMGVRYLGSVAGRRRAVTVAPTQFGSPCRAIVTVSRRVSRGRVSRVSSVASADVA